MIETGLLASDEDDTDYVLALFKHDGAKYCAMIAVDTDGKGDVICGEYTGASVTDENDIAWSMLTFTDVYTGSNFEIGFAEDEDECLILDQNGNTYKAEYLDADQTIEYFAIAAAFAK